MAALVFLFIGLICALIGRILLIGAAFKVSVWWGIGVLLPFGPLLFRLSYPGVAPLSLKFRMATLPCLLIYFLLQPNFAISRLPYDKIFKSAHSSAAPANRYATETKQDVANRALEERRAANAREFDRLRALAEALRLKKRDLLHSDAEGNLIYSIEVAKYNEALEKATAEKKAVWP